MKKLCNDIRFLSAIIGSNLRRPRLPFKLGFAVTYHCNLKCGMCNIWKKDGQGQELSLETIDQFFSKANSFSWVGLTGGEPFLRDDLARIADIVVSRCQQLSILHFATNGVLSEKIIAIAKHLREKYTELRLAFTVSLDGPPEMHDQIRGVPGTWAKAMQTFVALRQIPGVEARLGFTFSHQNLNSFDATLQAAKEYCSSLRFNDVNVNVFQKSEFYYTNQNLADIDPHAVAEKIDRILTMDRDPWTPANFLRRRYLQLYQKYLQTKKSPLKCQALSCSFYLDPYGTIFPCSVFNKRLVDIQKWEGDIRELWNSPEARQLAYECSHDRCPGCWTPCDANLAITGSLLKTLINPSSIKHV